MKKTSIKNDAGILKNIYTVVVDRKLNRPQDSYVAGLLESGGAKIHEKLSEETAELIDASQGADIQNIIHETADVLFHTIVLLGHHGIAPEAVYTELYKRWGVSGIQEKAARNRQ